MFEILNALHEHAAVTNSNTVQYDRGDPEIEINGDMFQILSPDIKFYLS